MKHYPVISGLFHVTIIRDPGLKLPGFNGKWPAECYGSKYPILFFFVAHMVEIPTILTSPYVFASRG